MFSYLLVAMSIYSDSIRRFTRWVKLIALNKLLF